MADGGVHMKGAKYGREYSSIEALNLKLNKLNRRARPSPLILSMPDA